MTILFFVLSVPVIFFVFGLIYLIFCNSSLVENNERLKCECGLLKAENMRLALWKRFVNAEDELKKKSETANEFLFYAERTKKEAEDAARIKFVESVSEIDNYKSTQRKILDELEKKIQESHKIYSYRKTLPDTHEKLKSKYEELKKKNEQLSAKLNDVNTNNKKFALDSKEREKIIAQFDKLGRAYVEYVFKFVVSKMTPNNFAYSRDTVLKAIDFCCKMGLKWSENFKEEYVEKIREEYKRVLRIEEMRFEQQRIKEHIREEARKQREIEILEKKKEQAIKERENSEDLRKAIQQDIDKALAESEGKNNAYILLLKKELAKKEQEIAAKQQEIDESQRAISNAQITKAGHIYVLSNIGSFGEGIFKIGMTRRDDPLERVSELSGAAVPFPFDVHLMVGTDNAPELEKILHKKFNHLRVNRVNMRKEYFRINVEDVQYEIESFLGKQVDYRVNPNNYEEYAEQYHNSQQATLDDIEETELLFREANVSIEYED